MDEKPATARKVMKLLTIVGGLAALVWAMRDRLISIPSEREDSPPSFRVSSGQRPR